MKPGVIDDGPSVPREGRSFSAAEPRRGTIMPNEAKKVTVPWVTAAAERGERLVMVTAYDYPQGRTADEAGVDIVLVGDSLAMVVLGHADTLAVTMDEMLHHVKAVRRGVERALLVADMPYGSFHTGPDEAVANALRFVKEGGAQAVKIEGARPEIVRGAGRRRGAGDGAPRAHPPVGAQAGRLQGAGPRRRGARGSARGGRARSRRREPSRWCSSACPRASPPRSASGCASRRSASAPAPAATARCSSTTTSSASRSASRRASCAATPSTGARRARRSRASPRTCAPAASRRRRRASRTRGAGRARRLGKLYG